MGISGRIAAFFIRSQLTPLLGIAVLLAGVFALVVTPREEDPIIDVALVEIFIPFPGASAKDVETLVAGPGERLLSRIQGVDHVVSVSRPGSALLTVQFVVGDDPARALVRLYDAINSSRDWLDPALGIGEPLIKSRAIDDVPVFTISLWTDDPQRSAYELGEIARSLEPELKRVAGTREVTTLGGPRRAVRVLIDPQQLAVRGVSALDLRNRLQRAAQVQTAGTLVKNDKEILLEAGEPFSSADDVSRLVVDVQDGRPVFLGDVARVLDGPEEAKSYVWFVPGKAASGAAATLKAAHPSVTLSVSKMRGVNAATLTPLIHERLEQLRGVLIPEGIEYTVTRDYGANARLKAQLLMTKLVFMTLVVSVMVFFALGWREAIVIALAVGLTLLLTLFAAWAVGITINRISLFALIFSVGFLVDDAIVVVENVHRWRTLQPEARLIDILPRAIDEVGGPTILATFTVIGALLPIAAVPGLMGSLMLPIPINSSMGMFLSLLVAFIFTPWLMLRILPVRTRHGAHAKPLLGGVEQLLTRVMRNQIARLVDEVHGRRRRHWLYLGAVGAVLASLLLPTFNLVLLKLLALDNQPEFVVVLDMPEGTPVEKTANTLFAIAGYLKDVPEITDYQIYAGGPGPVNFQGLVRQYYLRQSSEQGLIQVNLLDRRHRKRQSHTIAITVRDRIEAMAREHGGSARVAEPPPGPPVLSPIVAEIYGPDYEGQRAVGRFVRSVFETTPDIIGVSDSLGGGAQQLRFVIRSDRAARLGIAEPDIKDVLGMGFAGRDIGGLADASAQTGVPIRLSLPPESAGSISDLLSLKLKSADGTLVPLSELVEVISSERDAPIYHKDLRPVVFVLGDLGGKLDSPIYGSFRVRARLQELAAQEPSLLNGQLQDFLVGMPADIYSGYSVKWDGDWDITYKTFSSMGGAYVVGLGFIYLLLVAYFKSYVTPLVVMTPIPLTLIGVLPGHALLNMHFTASSVVGLAALAGIMVRNSILLVQFIDEQVAAGLPLRDAVIESTIARTRPIALAGLAAMLGGAMLFDDPIFSPLATSLVFGVAAATALTLLILPPLYFGLLQRRLSKRRPSLEATL